MIGEVTFEMFYVKFHMWKVTCEISHVKKSHVKHMGYEFHM